jgi:uncharacterized membrane protein
VAIAISLVPPLAVVGLTLESGAPGQAAGAMLLFATNVTAIIATGTVVLIGYRVRAAAVVAGRPVGQLRTRTVAVVGLLVLVVAVPRAALVRCGRSHRPRRTAFRCSVPMGMINPGATKPTA